MGVFKKGNRWYSDLYINGTRMREVVKLEGVPPHLVTRQDALKFLQIRQAEVAQGVYIAKKKKPILFDKLMESYLVWANENHRSPERDRFACKNLLANFSGKNIYALSLWDLEKYKSERKKQGRRPETINKELGVIRRMFNLASLGTLSVKIVNNPLQGMKLLQVPKLIPRVLKDWEFQKLYDAAPKHFRPILLCAYMTGMRRSEIAKLKWKDLDLESGNIHVVKTKNNESRTIPIVRPLYKTLLAMRESSSNEYVFIGPDGRPYTSATSWKRTWSTTLNKSRIERLRFHDLRHTFVSNLIVNEKEDYATVMALTGHKDIRMLLRYSHTQEEAKKAAIEKLGQAVDTSIMDTYSDTSSGNPIKTRLTKKSNPLQS